MCKLCLIKGLCLSNSFRLEFLKLSIENNKHTWLPPIGKQSRKTRMHLWPQWGTAPVLRFWCGKGVDWETLQLLHPWDSISTAESWEAKACFQWLCRQARCTCHYTMPVLSNVIYGGWIDSLISKGWASKVRKDHRVACFSWCFPFENYTG